MSPAEQNDAELLKRVLAILKTSPLIDGHNDVPWQYRKRVKNQLHKLDFAKGTDKLEPPMHTDIARMHRGGMGAQFWSVYVPADLALNEAVVMTMEQIDITKRLVGANPDHLVMAYTAADIETIHASGKIASLIGMEGGHSIGNSMAVLRQFYELGARYMTITHWQNHDWADAGTDEPRHHGLSTFGQAVIKEMNRLGMMVDLSHVSPDCMHATLDISQAPVIFSHSSARAVADHPRNVPDDILKRLKKSGGVVMVTIVPSFIDEPVRDWAAALKGETARLKEIYPHSKARVESGEKAWKEAHPSPKTTISTIADHIDHIVKIAGIDHVGIGGDFDGITLTPVGFEDVSRYPYLFVELLKRGYSDEAIAKIAGQNILSVFRAVEQTAVKLKSKTKPSDELIEELDAPAK